MRVFSVTGLVAVVLISQIAVDEKGSSLRRHSGLAGAPLLDRDGSWLRENVLGRLRSWARRI
jgi:hypothetical protein